DDVLKDDYKNPRKLWDEVLIAATPSLKQATTDHLTSLPNRSIRIPWVDPNSNEADPAYITEYGLSYPTPSGKLEFYTEALEQKFNTLGLSALPEFYSEANQLVDLPHLEFDKTTQFSSFFSTETLVHGAKIVNTPVTRKPQFNTELVTGRPPAPHFHSWTHYFWQAQEMWPELYCQIHPQKATALSINDGDTVIVETDNGQIKARAWIYSGIRPSSIFIPIGWDQQQPYHPASSVNHLTGIALDPVSQQANLKTHLCRVWRDD
ncbi:MAG: oxidoreductase, partial [Gammaproteobacteria bacterium]|nr:oxidoreductase [Gammaproteobacteria bacterium]